MTTLLFTHAACLEHDTGSFHPESPERLHRLLETLSRPEFSDLEWRRAPRAEHSHLARVHDSQYIADVLNAVPSSGRIELEGSGTVISSGSGEAALRAAGAACAAVDAVAAGEGKNAFCAVRPPGHHAEPSRTMGFCLFNNVAVGALHARIAHGFKRVAVVDFDVHHGNGTQAMFERDAALFLASTHQSFLFPYTGAENERGVGNIVNVTLARGWGGEEFRRLFAQKVLPRLTFFAPDFVLISAGFDALRADPIGGLRFDAADLVWATREIAKVAQRCCAGRLVSVLEGGYNPRTVASACAAHIRALMAA